MSNGKVALEEKVIPPNTKLTEALVVFQDLFHKYPNFQLMSEVDVLARIINEPNNVEEINKFIQSYIWPPDLENTHRGMAVMAILGYMLAKGEEKIKAKVL